MLFRSVLLVALGFAAGVLGGFFGIGGGWVVTPTLNFLGMPMVSALGTGLAYIFGTGAISVAKHAPKGNISGKIGAVIAAAMLAGIFGGSELVLLLKRTGVADSAIRYGYVALLLGMGLSIVRDFLRHGSGETQLASWAVWCRNRTWKPLLRVDGKNGSTAARQMALAAGISVTPPAVSLWVLAVGGVAAGVLAGVLGLGGGILVVPLLVYVVGLPTRIAVGTSLFCILLASPLGIANYARNGHVAFGVAAVMVLGALAGAPLGVWATQWVKAGYLRLLYGGILLLGSVAVTLREFGCAHSATWLILATAGGMAILVLALALRGMRNANGKTAG